MTSTASILLRNARTFDICYNNHLKACHVASQEEEIYNSLHHYISIPQNVRSTGTDPNTKRWVVTTQPMTMFGECDQLEGMAALILPFW